MHNVGGYLDSTAFRVPDTTAVRDRGRSYTYGQLQRMANGIMVGLLTNGIGRGSRVALCCSLRVGQIAAFFAILKSGATLVGADPGWLRRDYAEMLVDCKIDAILCSADPHDMRLAETLASAVRDTGRSIPIWTIPKNPDDTAVSGEFASVEPWYGGRVADLPAAPVTTDDVATIAFTSGTTGRRKGVQLTHGNIAAMTLITLPLADWGACRRRLGSGDYEGIMAQLFLLLLPVFMGDTIVLCESRDPEEVLRIMASEGVTYMVEMSVFYHNVLTYPGRQFDEDIRKNLQLCVTGGAAFPETWYEAFLERFGVPILPGYGATETTTCVSWCLERDGYVRGKVGRPVPGVKVRILAEDGSIRPVGAEGEIVVSSPGVMKGYFEMPVETARVLHDGWYRTGDLGLIDTDGQLVIMGRLDDKIMSGYYRIDPTAVESMICSHPQVSLAAVVGVPDEVLGERAKAYIVMNPGMTPDPEGLRHWLADRLPEWMVPELMEFLPALPLTATGKVARAALRSV